MKNLYIPALQIKFTAITVICIHMNANFWNLIILKFEKTGLYQNGSECLGGCV